MGHDEEKAMLMEFVKDHSETFIEFVEDLDSTILWDFAESMRWAWNHYKEENRSA